VDTKTDYAKIVAAFESSLTVIKKVTDDKYLGQPEMQDTADSLAKMIEDMKKLADKVEGPCAVQVQLYCNLYNQGQSIIDSILPLQAALKLFTDHEYVLKFEENSGKLEFMKGGPAFLLIGMLFFLMFFLQGDATCCGSCCGCACLSCCTFYWLFFLIICSIIAGLGMATMQLAKTEKLASIPGEPTIDELLTHIEVEFTEFYDYVFKDMIASMLLVYKSAIVYEGVLSFIFWYSCCLCCCRPYKVVKKETE